MSLLERLTAPGPKRILALDGGGIRGVITLAFLERLEDLLRKRYGQPDYRLCDYFDLIGGTSTGAMIGAGLAIGMEVASLKKIYLELGTKAFSKRRFNPLNALYNSKPLQDILQESLGDIKLNDESIRTGLCIMAKRADTRSTWPLINHPYARYYERNGEILLHDAVHASTAAPGFFQPKSMNISRGKRGTFVDGGVSLANNPALELFLIATLKGFPFRWQTGEDSLMMVSVGTGEWQEKFTPEEVMNHKVWNWATEVPQMLIEEGESQAQLILQLLSRTPTPRIIDREIGNLEHDLLTPEPLLHYLRYDVKLEPDVIESLGVGHLSRLIKRMRRIDAAEYRHELAHIGHLASDGVILHEHFPSVFDHVSTRGLEPILVAA